MDIVDDERNIAQKNYDIIKNIENTLERMNDKINDIELNVKFIFLKYKEIENSDEYKNGWFFT
tara:strand:- start:530 stop:718 length:189 start_codon:yes stop_codon:yes gene_type:complete